MPRYEIIDKNTGELIPIAQFARRQEVKRQLQRLTEEKKRALTLTVPALNGEELAAQLFAREQKAE